VVRRLKEVAHQVSKHFTVERVDASRTEMWLVPIYLA
jgi:hypothetical protein